MFQEEFPGLLTATCALEVMASRDRKPMGRVMAEPWQNTVCNITPGGTQHLIRNLVDIMPHLPQVDCVRTTMVVDGPKAEGSFYGDERSVLRVPGVGRCWCG